MVRREVYIDYVEWHPKEAGGWRHERDKKRGYRFSIHVVLGS